MRKAGFILAVVSGAASAGSGGDAIGQLIAITTGPTIEASFAASSQASTEGSKSSGRSSSAVAPNECDRNSDCHAAWVCNAGRCVAPAPVSAPPPPPVPAPPTMAVPKDGRCGQDSDCERGLTCKMSYCAVPEQVLLKRQAVQVYLSARAVELREELVFGRGPIIATLAGITSRPAAQVGQALRSHRAELIALIGDGSDAQWSTRFMQRLDALIAG